MSGVVGWPACWWWGARNWWRLVGWTPRSAGDRSAPKDGEPWEGAPPGGVVLAPSTVIPAELALLRSIFGPDSEADLAPAAGERAYRFGQAEIVTGAPVYWTECDACGGDGPEAGTADAALAWVFPHRSSHGGQGEFRLSSTAPVRLRPVPQTPGR
jgi:hypothetical protein